MRKFLTITAAAALIASLFIPASCSTTKLLADDESRLVENVITVNNDAEYNVSELQPYIKQKPNSFFIGKWNPFLYVYNWGDNSGSGWDRFTKKLGVAPVVFDSTQVAGSCKSLISHLELLGYYYSTVDHKIRTKNKKTSVAYDVTIGKQFPIRSIEYIIRDSTLKALTAKDSANFSISPGNHLSQEALENESERMAAHFRDNGYYGFTKNYFFYYADTTTFPGTADLIVKLEDYTRNELPSSAKAHTQYHIGAVEIVPAPNMKVKQKFLRDICLVTPGDLYRESVINNTYNRYASVNLFSNVNIQTRAVDSSTVNCVISLTPAKMQGIKVNAEASVNSSGLFAITPSISYYHRNVFGGGEYFSMGFKGNFQMNKLAYAQEYAVSSSLTLPKFLGLPQSVFPSTLPKTEFNITFNYQDRPEYKRAIISTKYGYNWVYDNNKFFQVYPAKLSAVNVYETSGQTVIENIKDPYLRNSFKSHFDLGSSASLYYTTNTEVNPKVNYFYTRVQADWAGNSTSLLNTILKENKDGERTIWGMPYSQYVRGEMQAVQTIWFGRNNSCSIALRALAGAGLAYGNSKSLPFEQLFYAGGANSLRGWQSRAVGPGAAARDTSFVIANQSGDMHLELNAELRFPLFWKLYGALFVDAGNIWTLKHGKDLLNHHDSSSDIASNDQEEEFGRFTFKDMLKTTAANSGLGLRLDFGLLMVRVDWGIKVYDPSTKRLYGINDWFSKDGSCLHFGVGLPF